MFHAWNPSNQNNKETSEELLLQQIIKNEFMFVTKHFNMACNVALAFNMTRRPHVRLTITVFQMIKFRLYSFAHTGTGSPVKK